MNLNRFAVDCYVVGVAVALFAPFICLLFSETKRHETKLKYIESFTFRHFSSEFRFVASVRCTIESVFCLFAHFQFLRLTCMNISHCFAALCFQTMTSSRDCVWLCGYLWQIARSFHFACHFFVFLCALSLGIIFVCANANASKQKKILNFYIWLEATARAMTTHLF